MKKVKVRVKVMNAYQDLRLHEWIAIGKATGKIREARTVVLAYCMDEREVLPWIVDIVRGQTTEENAVIFMERAIQYAS
jgi:hypothetical protein